ncbi:hypothetical protein [Lacisediminihabitans changchengi]|uniref:Uncharacterized protein n=1 Tax=Lacisediminihabitans changchengi TaxID=2787634 RepID=A0A934W2F7_9MICO|nr:hypothetical protein [Lacisediminihabitans changchengi]MBK4347009.1 hypothetical protein [Lacisediminihabitans changchengi]MBK4347868.1 hypothetical protein [Lacisediminihabitans changchengi]
MSKFGWNRRSATSATVTIVVAGALVLGGVVPAQALDSSDISDPTATLAVIAPELLAETSTEAPVDIEKPLGDDAAIVSVGTAKATDESTSGALDGSGGGVRFSIEYATETVSVDSGITVVASQSADVNAYVQPTASGVRVLTAINSATAPTHYDYHFDVPADTKLVEGAGVSYLESGDHVLGTISEPWAIDSAGRKLPTSYSWNDGVLTQNVDLSAPDLEFPVLADPAWSYAYTYAVTKTAAQAKSLLKRCFNCYFPVDGAPRGFPVANQLLPLHVGPGNFECRFKREITSTNYFGFQFDATKNHVDGYGSNVVFEFKLVGGNKRLVVSAYIVNDSWWLHNGAYEQGALTNWRNFASNISAG